MYVPEKLHLNKFVAVRCPHPKDLYQRVGQRMPNIDNMSNDGSEYSEPIDFISSGIQQLEKMANQERINLYNEYVESQRKASQVEEPKPSEE